MGKMNSIGLALAEVVKAVFRNSVILPPQRTRKSSQDGIREPYFLTAAMIIAFIVAVPFFFLLITEIESDLNFLLIFFVFPAATILGFICSIVAWVRKEPQIPSIVCFCLYAIPSLGSIALLLTISLMALRH